MEHTKDKWVVQPLETAHNGYKDWKTFAIRSEETNVCLAVVGEVDRYCEKQNEANARLMAAAPELLEACKTLLYNAELMGMTVGVEQAQQAIAKATT